MSVMDRFEKRIERFVNGAFAKVFRSQVEPVELAGALRKESDTRAAVVSRGRTLTANSYVIELSQGDFERLGPIEDDLRPELRQVVAEHAAEQGYSCVGPITVSFEMADDLDTGMYRVRATTRRPDGSPAAQPANRGGYDPPSRANPIVAEAYEQSQENRVRSGAGNTYPGPADSAAAARRAAGATGCKYFFTVDVGDRSYNLKQGTTVFGRSSNSADIVLSDPGISRRHFEITVDGNHATASDLGSTNGTMFDGRPITSITLTDGVTLVAGDTHVTFHQTETGAQ
ncbi:DUF3662 and FHA domain-containing protein [Brevibacterium sp. 50QC2O2]|jgi:hypothetical protein|uniref:DUF3662 and FHA domain-containing protein n=1 Tax=Brevibacterium sp. 50QC2O2 TaxID=2968459 RepID=UPI00211BF51D|nr:DUF3662 and FHA domain-containing protein [Brevibacterium sp. 50QC2O2]MCQ9389718.1 DUF3662 and FHA domain-containing protein [Brevibacterium sp. 50QC2O2]